MSQADEDNNEKTDKLDCIDAISGHLVKARGIVDIARLASGPGPMEGAMWAAQDHLDEAKEALERLAQHLGFNAPLTTGGMR
jgi:predicted dinucleotide-binding enzyme